MIPTDVAAPPPTEDQASRPAPAAPARAAAPAGGPRFWAGVLLCCAALAASGVLRVWQERRVDAMLLEGRQSPFPLEELPMTLGPWVGSEAQLDPEIAKATGAVDHAFRRYVNQQTGAAVDLIALYGPATNMYVHAPEVCYPGTGYTRVDGPDIRKVPLGDGREAPFRSLVYARGENGVSARQEVYYAWRYFDRWSPDSVKHKQYERIPGMFKVQLAREVLPGELREVANPCESLLGYLMPELERRIEAAEAARAGTADAEATAS